MKAASVPMHPPDWIALTAGLAGTVMMGVFPQRRVKELLRHVRGGWPVALNADHRGMLTGFGVAPILLSALLSRRMRQPT